MTTALAFFESIDSFMLIVAGFGLMFLVITRGPAGMHQEAPWTELLGSLLALICIIVGIIITVGGLK